MATWKILRGILQEDSNTKLVSYREEPKDKDGTKGKRLAEEGYFIPGDIIRTNRDLNKLNSPGGPRKYEKIDEKSVIEDDERSYPDLDNMSVAQLRKHAKSEGIDLETATSKDEIANTIRAALQEA